MTGMVGGAPLFLDDGPYRFNRSIDSEYLTIQKSLDNMRKKIGEERYLKLIEMAATTRALFESDPDRSEGKTLKGCHMLQEMIAVLYNRKWRQNE